MATSRASLGTMSDSSVLLSAPGVRPPRRRDAQGDAGWMSRRRT